MNQLRRAAAMFLIPVGIWSLGCGGEKEISSDPAVTVDQPTSAPVESATGFDPAVHAYQIQFDTQEPIGSINTRAVESDDINAWSPYLEASGAVPIPKGMEVQLDLTEGNVSDLSALASVEPSSIYEINLSSTAITDEQLAHVANLTGLRGLNLNETNITDEGMAHIGKLTRLHKLSLGNTQITNAGIDKLVGLSELQRLWLQNTSIGDPAMGTLSGLPNLKWLILTNTQITDAGVNMLSQGATRLTDLGIGQTRVTTEGVIALEKFKSLSQVDLTGIPVGADPIRALATKGILVTKK